MTLTPKQRQQVRAAIDASGKTLTAVAAEIGTSHGSLSGLLSGARNGSIDLWRRVGAACGLEIREERRVTVTRPQAAAPPVH